MSYSSIDLAISESKVPKTDNNSFSCARVINTWKMFFNTNKDKSMAHCSHTVRTDLGQIQITFVEFEMVPKQTSTHLHSIVYADRLTNGENIDSSVWFIFPSCFSLKNYPFAHEMDSIFVQLGFSHSLFYTFTCTLACQIKQISHSIWRKMNYMKHLCVFWMYELYSSEMGKNWNESFFAYNFHAISLQLFIFYNVNRCYSKYSIFGMTLLKIK